MLNNNSASSVSYLHAVYIACVDAIYGIILKIVSLHLLCITPEVNLKYLFEG